MDIYLIKVDTEFAVQYLSSIKNGSYYFSDKEKEAIEFSDESIAQKHVEGLVAFGIAAEKIEIKGIK